MSTYVVVNVTITDRSMLDQYRAAVGATMAGHDVELLLSSNDAEAVEGTPAGERVVILRFPDRAAFRAWYDSDAYQAVIGLRLDSTEGFMVVADSVS